MFHVKCNHYFRNVVVVVFQWDSGCVPNTNLSSSPSVASASKCSGKDNQENSKEGSNNKGNDNKDNDNEDKDNANNNNKDNDKQQLKLGPSQQQRLMLLLMLMLMLLLS